MAAPAERLVDSPAPLGRTWLPADRDGSRFQVDGAVKTYDKETVFDLLNGGAEVLLEQGLVFVYHGRFVDGNGKFTAWEVQVVDYSSAARARARLAKEKPPRARPVKIGDQGFSDRGSVVFVRGRHLVSINVQPQGTLPFAPVAEIARRVVATPGARW